jgi:cytochrome c oxidase cbb3-type subunit I/II
METQKFSYDNSIVRAFLYATIIFGFIGFTFGLTAALMLFYPELPEFLFGQMIQPSEVYHQVIFKG